MQCHRFWLRWEKCFILFFSLQIPRDLLCAPQKTATKRKCVLWKEHVSFLRVADGSVAGQSWVSCPPALARAALLGLQRRTMGQSKEKGSRVIHPFPTRQPNPSTREWWPSQAVPPIEPNLRDQRLEAVTQISLSLRKPRLLWLGHVTGSKLSPLCLCVWLLYLGVHLSSQLISAYGIQRSFYLHPFLHLLHLPSIYMTTSCSWSWPLETWQLPQNLLGGCLAKPAPAPCKREEQGTWPLVMNWGNRPEKWCLWNKLWKQRHPIIS